LAGEGLTDVDANRGVVVHEPTLEELEEVYKLRQLLEAFAIESTVRNITEDELVEGDRLLERMETTNDNAEWALLNAAYHGLLSEASRMPILRSLLVRLRNLSTVYIVSLIERDEHRLAQANAEHRALLEACRARDAARARQIEADHLDHTRQIVGRYLRSQGATSAESDLGERQMASSTDFRPTDIAQSADQG
jgi:DNA-binding GntR family transcriptional regulator